MTGKGNAFFAVFGITYAVVAASAPLPMPATTPEEIIALAHRTYDYVARSVPEKELAALKDELAIDEKWYADAKKANDAREMRNAVRELKSVRRRILFRHPDLQFKTSTPAAGRDRDRDSSRSTTGRRRRTRRCF